MTALPVYATLALQAAPAPGPGGGGMTVLLLQFVLIFGIFYFLMIRPQQKQRKEHEARLRALKRGDEIVTAGGIVGEIVHITQGTKDGQAVVAMDDRVTIKSGDTRLIVERGRIARVGGVAGPADKGTAA